MMILARGGDPFDGNVLKKPMPSTIGRKLDSASPGEEEKTQKRSEENKEA